MHKNAIIINMELYVDNTTNYKLKNYEKLYEHLFLKTLKKLSLDENYIMSVTFVSIDKIHEINLNYRHIDRPTDVISFAFMDDINEKNISGDFPKDLGEIYICYDVADENRKKYDNSIERELSFLFVHGLLHLLGYDHMEKEDEVEMFKLQDEILEGENLQLWINKN